MKLEEISPSTPVADLPEQTLLQFDVGRGILTAKPGGPAQVGARLELSHGDFAADDLGVVAPDRPLEEVVQSVAGEPPLRAFRLPPGAVVHEARSVRQRRRNFQVRAVIVLLTLAVVAVGRPFLGWFPAWRTAYGYGLVVWAALAVLLWWAHSSGTERAYSIAGKLWFLDQFELPEDRGTLVTRQVDQIKSEYGRLICDLAYRLEFPALFDAAEPHTEELTLALFEWDSSAPRLTTEERVALGRRVVSAFDEARAHAERIGMGHLPDAAREPADEALSAVRLATASTVTDAERAAALERASAILDDLALYYLPSGTDARNAITGRTRPQLPGRRNS